MAAVKKKYIILSIWGLHGGEKKKKQNNKKITVRLGIEDTATITKKKVLKIRKVSSKGKLDQEP